MKKLSIVFVIALFAACKSKEAPIVIAKELTAQETVELILSEAYIEELGIDEKGRMLLFEFYEKRGFKPLWASKKKLNETGDTLLKLLKNPIQFGMTDRRFDLHFNESEPIQNEIALVCGIVRSYSDLRFGMLDSTKNALQTHQYLPLEKLDTLLHFEAHNYFQKFLSWGPADSTYQQLTHQLFAFVQNNPIDIQPLSIPAWKEDSIAALQVTKTILVAKSYLAAEQQNDSLAFKKALKQFQAASGCAPDGVIGASTIRQLTESNLHKAQRIALAMEKQRKTNAFPKRYFRINIPEYMLRLHNEDTLCSENRIVVGTFDHQTPELTSFLHTIVIYPYWNVPYSIASKEILPALKLNPKYLEKNDMVLLQKKDTIDPKKVKWKKIKENTFPYRVVQQPGHKNSLGVVKFDFHNKFDVYFHDTPTKGLFKTVARSYSHGCMRTENPIDLAKITLTLDENPITTDSIDSMLYKTGINRSISLKKRIPIFIEYRTVLIQDNELVILRDVYLRDEKYLSILFDQKVQYNSNNK